MTIHSRLSFSHAPVTVFVFAIFCFVFFWQHCIIGDTLSLKRNSPAQQCGLFVHWIWQATESDEKKKKKNTQKQVTAEIIKIAIRKIRKGERHSTVNGAEIRK